jgi:hypothetical protein
MTRKIHIFYRHVPQKADARSRDPNKRRPDWFTYERCFHNLAATILLDKNAANVHLTVMFDGSVDEFQVDFVSSYVKNFPRLISIKFLTAGSDRLSGMLTLHYINSLELPATDIIYQLENDYIHQDNWVTKLLELYDSNLNFDYISLYDHPDKYFYEMYQGLSAQIVCSSSHHWRTAPSSCGSFISDFYHIQTDYDIFKLGLPDYYFFKALCEGRARTLLTPIPGLSTHCMEGYLSPFVDWRLISERVVTIPVF